MSERPADNARLPSNEEAVLLADAWLDRSVSAVEVESRLCERGVPADAASVIVEELLKRRLLERARPGERRDRAHMRRAIFWSVFGVALGILGTVLAMNESGFASPWFWGAAVAALGLGAHHFLHWRG